MHGSEWCTVHQRFTPPANGGSNVPQKVNNSQWYNNSLGLIDIFGQIPLKASWRHIHGMNFVQTRRIEFLCWGEWENLAKLLYNYNSKQKLHLLSNHGNFVPLKNNHMTQVDRNVRNYYLHCSTWWFLQDCQWNPCCLNHIIVRI